MVVVAGAEGQPPQCNRKNWKNRDEDELRVVVRARVDALAKRNDERGSHKWRLHAHLGRGEVEHFEAEHGHVGHRAACGFRVVEVILVSGDDARVLIDDLEGEDEDRDLVAQLPLYDVSVPLPRSMTLVFSHLVQTGQPHICTANGDHDEQDRKTENEQPPWAERVLALLAHCRCMIPARTKHTR